MSNEENKGEVNLETEPSLDFSELKDTGVMQEENNQNLEESKLSETDHEAKKFGHLTKEEWEKQGRDPNQWKTPGEFVRYGREYREVKDLIRTLKDQNAQQAAQINMLVDYHKQNAESVVQKAKIELEERLRQARDIGDLDSMQKLIEQKVNLEVQQKQQQEVIQRQTMNQIDMAFMERNKHWFNDSNPALKEKSKQIAAEVNMFYPNHSYAERVQMIENRMKFEHPDINVQVNSMAPQISQSRSNINKSSIEPTVEDRSVKNLSQIQQAEYLTVRDALSKRKINYTVQEYLENLKRQKERGN